MDDAEPEVSGRPPLKTRFPVTHVDRAGPVRNDPHTSRRSSLPPGRFDDFDALFVP